MTKPIMLDVVLPEQYLRRPATRAAEPHRRLMAAVLQTVVDDCRGTTYRRARNYQNQLDATGVQRATAYVLSTDRAWPFSFENLCDALGLNAARLRVALRPASPAGRGEASERAPARLVAADGSLRARVP